MPKQMLAPPRAPPARTTRSGALIEVQHNKPRYELGDLYKARIDKRCRVFGE